MNSLDLTSRAFSTALGEARHRISSQSSEGTLEVDSTAGIVCTSFAGYQYPRKLNKDLGDFGICSGVVLVDVVGTQEKDCRGMTLRYKSEGRVIQIRSLVQVGNALNKRVVSAGFEEITWRSGHCDSARTGSLWCIYCLPTPLWTLPLPDSNPSSSSWQSRRLKRVPSLGEVELSSMARREYRSTEDASVDER